MDLFVPGQLFAFGSIMLHADSTGHLDQIDNFAPERQIRFGHLEYVTDAWGDLVFTGFTTPQGLVAPALTHTFPIHLTALGQEGLPERGDL